MTERAESDDSKDLPALKPEKSDFWRKRIARLILVIGLVSAGLVYGTQAPTQITYRAPSTLKIKSLSVTYTMLKDKSITRGMQLNLRAPVSVQEHLIKLPDGKYDLAIQAQLLDLQGKELLIFQNRRIDADGDAHQIQLQLGK